MGKYDRQIAWLRERRQFALEDIETFESGQFKIGNLLQGELVDQTDELLQRAKRDVERFDKLIAAYEAQNA